MASRPSQLPSTSGGRTGTAAGSIAGRGNVGTGNRGGNVTGGGNRGNISGGNRGNNINTGDRNNINIDRDGIGNINADVDWGWHPGYGYGWGYGAAAAAGAVVGAAVTSAAIGSAVYALPPSCVSSLYGGLTYYNCNDVWYQAQFQGDNVTYIVVEKP
jgi:YHS domain-containing protein